MKDYANNDTLKEDEISKLFKETTTCPLCKNIFINPFMCLKCQKVFCKNCIDKWNENDKNCPNNCQNPDYEKCNAKNEILSHFRFICVGCEGEIKYDEAENHHNICCPGKTSKDFIKKQIKIKKLNSEEANILSENGNEFTFLTGK